MKETRPNLLAQDSGGKIVNFRSVGRNSITSARTTRATVFCINRGFTSEGWIRSCEKCGQHYVLKFVAATIRDGREKLCVDCYVEGLRND